MPVKLTIIAILLALKVRKISHTPLDRLIIDLAATRGLPRASRITDAATATQIACRLVGRLGLLNTCITRSVVMGTLIADRPNVTIHIGFRPSESHQTEGHAWLTCNDKLIPLFAGEADEVRQYQRTLSFPLQR